MTRGNPGDLQPFDPEIDRTFHRLVRLSVHPGHFMHFVHSEHSVEGVILNILILSIPVLIFILRTWLNLHLVRGLIGR